jgi:lipopolysaccharide export system protein LptA
MEASGGVSIVSKDQVGTGDNGTYDRQRNEVVLIGNVSLSQGGTVIKGLKDSRLVYDLNTSQAVIVGGVSSIITPGSEDGRKDEAPRKPAAR